MIPGYDYPIEYDLEKEVRLTDFSFDKENEELQLEVNGSWYIVHPCIEVDDFILYKNTLWAVVYTTEQPVTFEINYVELLKEKLWQ